jgi:uncharacterized membrane protein YpjA
MRTLRKLARAALVLVGALLLNLYGALWSGTALAATTLAQAQVDQPRAPGFVFFLLVALIFVAVLAFSFTAYRDVNR